MAQKILAGTFGPGDRDIFKNVQNLYQIQQNFVYTRSTHNMKWGFDYQKLGTNTDGGPRDNGAFTWGSATQFLTDQRQITARPLAAAQMRSTSSCGKTIPPERLCVFSITTAVVPGKT